MSKGNLYDSFVEQYYHVWKQIYRFFENFQFYYQYIKVYQSNNERQTIYHIRFYIEQNLNELKNRFFIYIIGFLYDNKNVLVFRRNLAPIFSFSCLFLALDMHVILILIIIKSVNLHMVLKSVILIIIEKALFSDDYYQRYS